MQKITHSIVLGSGYSPAVLEKIEELCKNFGNNARPVLKNGEFYTATLAKKPIIPFLSNFCALLCGGGIWMNAQCLEWNDANNTIVGIGLLLVTVYHMYSYVKFMTNLMQGMENKLVFSENVVNCINQCYDIINA